MSSNQKISQKDLRKMMKERQLMAKTSQETDHKTIESPLARYDLKKRLSCIVCQQYISSDSLWSQHIVSKDHKNKIEEMKRKTIQTKSEKIDKKTEDLKPFLKRKNDSNNEDIIQKKMSKNCLQIKTEKIENKSNELIESNDVLDSNRLPITSDSGLPNDFFDDNQQTVDTNKQKDSEESEMDTNCESNTIPKGFFDDPISDAKARKVVYKDPIDEEWDHFQKAIAEENTVSQNIIEEDIEELQMNRNLEEIEEQIESWLKVNEMQKRVELIQKHIANTNHENPKEESSDSEVEEHDLNLFSNWRSRTGLNSK